MDFIDQQTKIRISLFNVRLRCFGPFLKAFVVCMEIILLLRKGRIGRHKKKKTHLKKSSPNIYIYFY